MLTARLEAVAARIHGIDPQPVLTAVLGAVVFGMSGAMLLLIYLPVR